MVTSTAVSFCEGCVGEYVGVCVVVHQGGGAVMRAQGGSERGCDVGVR